MKLNSNKFRINKQNISYYNEIADNYNHVLEQENSNRIIREKIAEKFHHIVREGEILDFGGGTGLDMEWLTNNGYRVIFCEPSIGMREKAVELNQNVLHSTSIDFLDDEQVDFTQWIKKLPFSKKVDAILANFAVINNIKDIELLFRALALVVKPGGHLLALILNESYKNKVKSNWLRDLGLFILHKPFSFTVHHKENRQIVFIHTIKEIKHASARYFDFCDQELILQSGFSLIHLIGK